MNNTEMRRIAGILTITAGVAFAAPGPVWAENSDQATDMAAIIVTGERVKRSLMDTAASVALFDAERLSEQAGADRLEQPLDFVPNLQRGSHDIGPTIRGQDTTGILIGANAFLGGTRPRATLRLDGRQLNFNEFVYGLSSLWDVERIEVFRGPQTTTQGRNAIAGAIFVETRDPTFDFEGNARLLAGSDQTRQASLALSGPLVDRQLAGRVSIDRRAHESWMNYVRPDVFVGASREADDSISARAKLLFRPDALPSLELLLTYAHLDANNPQNETADAPFSDRVQAVQNGAHWRTEVDSIALQADYAFSAAWQGSLTFTYADSRSTRFAAPGLGSAQTDAAERSIEVLTRFDPPAGRLRGLVGAAYFAGEQDESSDLSAFLGFGRFSDQQQSVGIFGEATLAATSRLRLTAGGRWQHDAQDRAGRLGRVALDYDQTFSAFLAKTELAYDLSEQLVVGLSARRGFNPGGTTISFTTGAVDEFGAETLWSYEMFWRQRLAGGALMLAGNLFYTDFDNAQRPLINLVTLPNGRTVESTQFSNAPSAESYGLELEGVWTPDPALKVRASVGLLETEITATLRPNDPILNKAFQRSPRFSGALGIELRPIDPVRLNLNLRYHSGYFSNDANTPAFKVAAGAVINARASYDLGPASVFAYVRNVGDRTYKVWQFRPRNASLGDPREYGLGLEMRF